MATNLDIFKADLAKLEKQGGELYLAMFFESCNSEGEQLKATVKKKAPKKPDPFANLPSFSREYQKWYSEALAVIRQVLPDRVTDFQNHYAKPKNRKEVTFENYRIEDYLQGLQITRVYTKEIVVGKSSAIPHFEQQRAILAAANARFESSLYDIRNLVQADLFDSEIDAAEHLAKSKFYRAAGALAGVVLESHLSQVCINRQIKIAKKNATISTFNDALKTEGAIDIPQWRFVQHLGDIRNLCDHAKGPEPTREQIADLISGVRKTTKTIF